MSDAVCPVRRLTEADAAQVCTLMQGNPLFYRYHPPQPTPESIRTDMTALPPGKAMEDKWFVGFYDGDCLIAVMDLILNYPAADTAFIGLFMTAHDRQGCGLGSRILRDCRCCYIFNRHIRPTFCHCIHLCRKSQRGHSSVNS